MSDIKQKKKVRKKAFCVQLILNQNKGEKKFKKIVFLYRQDK